MSLYGYDHTMYRVVCPFTTLLFAGVHSTYQTTDRQDALTLWNWFRNKSVYSHSNNKPFLRQI